MKPTPQGWVILKCKKVGDFEVQNDTGGICWDNLFVFTKFAFSVILY